MTLWVRDRDTVWALNGLGRLNRGHRPVWGWHRGAYGRTIQVVPPKLPYGRASAKGIQPKTVSHIPDRVLLAWKDGRLRGWGVLWFCGGLPTEVQFEHQPSRKLCWQCAHYAGLSDEPVSVPALRSPVRSGRFALPVPALQSQEHLL